MIRYLVVIFCLQAAPLMAGAWPREQGSGFVSLSHWAAQNSDDSYTAFFAEWGLTRHLTIGIDSGRAVSGESKAVVFLRSPLVGFGGAKVAAELGFGEIAGQPVMRPGLSFGHALHGALGRGWLAVDGLLELDLDQQQIDIKADITLGLVPAARHRPDEDGKWTLMLQLQTGLIDVQDSLALLKSDGIVPDPSFLRIAPSVTYRLHDRLDLEFGIYRSLNGSGEQGLKFGVWSRF